MNEYKLSSDEVPQKFAEWLLSMGCPPENVPTVDKVAEKCRGQYYMVWRSLMEKVESKNIIQKKRLQVFCDDIKRCQKLSPFSEQHTQVVVPEELSLWKQHSQLKEKVADTEVRVMKEKDHLQQVMDKVSSKFSHRILSRKRLQDAHRRAWLLQQLAEELKRKKANLEESKSIAESLCGLDDDVNIESKVDKCVKCLSRNVPAAAAGGSKYDASLMSAANPGASSSIASTTSEVNDEEVMSSVVKCRGDVLYKQLYEKRSGLCAAMPAAQEDENTQRVNRITPQSVLSHTAALHCNLALEAMKNRVHIKLARNRLVSAANELSNNLSEEAIELLVLRCEKASSEARVAAMRALCEEVASRSGIFATGSHQKIDASAATHIHSVDKNIRSKRDELKRLVTSVTTVERKTQNVKECLLSLFNSFHDDGSERDNDRFGLRSSLPQESISTICQYYEEKSEKRRNKVDLSIDFDVSEKDSFDLAESGNSRFGDELKLFLKKFNLEQNRTLILESGEKIWIFETLQSLILQFYVKWQDEDITTSMICPSVNLKRNLQQLERHIARKDELEGQMRALEDGGRTREMNIDITQTTSEEEKTLDRIKKSLNENIFNLQKTSKAVDIAMENIQLWSENGVKKHISDNRTISGKSYREYEREHLLNKVV